MRVLLFFLLSLSTFAQKGGLPTYPVTKLDSTFIKVDNSDSLLKYAAIRGSNIYITKSFELKSRIIVASNVTIESDLKTITSKLFFSTFRNFESFTIKGSGVIIRGLNLVGDDPDIRTIDSVYYQCGIRCDSTNFSLINCRMSKWGWACLYLHLSDGALIDQCYFADTKNNGYGYGLWFEGKHNHKAVVKNCWFQNLREGADAGGQLTHNILTGNICESGFTSHRNGLGYSALLTDLQGNYMNDCSFYYPPPADSGKLIIKNNFMTDTSAIMVTGTNPKSTVIIENNEPLALSPFTIILDSVVGARHYFRFAESYPLYEIYYGDGSQRVLSNSKKFNKTYSSGSYTIKVRGISSNGIPSAWGYKRINVKAQAITAYIKSSARFEKSGYYSVQFLRNDTVVYSIDVTKIWKDWTKVYIPCSAGKLSFRLTCNKSTPRSVIVWVDDFDYNGQIPNSDFEIKGNWIQKLAGTNIGSGQDCRERTSGGCSYRFEFRNPVNTVGYGEVFQTVK